MTVSEERVKHGAARWVTPARTSAAARGSRHPSLGRPGVRHQRIESERFRRFTHEELAARDKVSLDIFWLRDEGLEDTDDLPAPGIIAAEIVEDLQSALAEFAELAERLQGIGVDITES